MECGGHGSEERASAGCFCSSASTGAPSSSSSSQPKVCCKCKEAPAQVAANQTEVLCATCLHSALFSKFKTAINMHGLIVPSDRVLLAFSGGPSSRVALEYLLDLRQKAQRDANHYSDSRARVFGFGVAHVNESSVIPLALRNAETIKQELLAIVMGREKRPDEFLDIPIENVYSDAKLDVGGANNTVDNGSQERLQDLLKNVTDPTGKEDLLELLRMHALQQAAKKHGYTRLVLGISTTRIAAKAIAQTSKGCGFSFPAGIQYYDGRWTVPVVLPLRDCVAKELVLLCHFRNLKWVFIPTLSTLTLPQKTINSLSAAFVSILQEENPSRERTIMRTATKLQPFLFNRAPCLQAILSNKKGTTAFVSNGTQDIDDTIVESLCRLCCAPLDPQESMGTMLYHRGSQEDEIAATPDPDPLPTFWEECCHCCQYQILQKGRLHKTQTLLPPSMKTLDFVNPKIREMWLRSRISDCILSDCEVDDGEAVT